MSRPPIPSSFHEQEVCMSRAIVNRTVRCLVAACGLALTLGATAVYQFDNNTDAKYRKYLSAVDWVSNDVYPLTQWNRPQWVDRLQSQSLSAADPFNASATPFNPGTAVDKLRDLSGGKKQFA